MIPTQPELPNPWNPDGTWRPNAPLNGYVCQFCNQWVGNWQYHNCPGTPIAPLRTTDNTNELNFGGIVSEIQMYSDFKKLFKRSTLAKFRGSFIDRLAKLESDTPADSDTKFGFGLDAIEDVFDYVAKGFYDDNSV